MNSNRVTLKTTQGELMTFLDVMLSSDDHIVEVMLTTLKGNPIIIKTKILEIKLP